MYDGSETNNTRQLERTLVVINQKRAELDQHLKAQILEVLYRPVTVAKKKGPLMVALHRTMASLGRCFEGTEDKLYLPDHD